MEEKKDTFLIARIPSDMKNQLQEDADDKNVSLSKVARDIIAEHYK